MTCSLFSQTAGQSVINKKNVGSGYTLEAVTLPNDSVLGRNGAGSLTSYNISSGGNGVSDNGKIAIFGATGYLKATKELSIIRPSALAPAILKLENGDGGRIEMHYDDGGITNQQLILKAGTMLVEGGSGSSLTNLNASNISSGELSLARIGQNSATSGQALAWNGTAWSPATITGASPSGSGSELQYRSGASTFGAVTGSSVSGGAITLGTGLIINAASGFTGKLIDAQVNGSSAFSYTYNSGTRGLLSLGSAGGAAISIYADPGKVTFGSSVQCSNGTYYVSSDLADSSGAFLSRNYGETTTHFVLASDGDAVAATMQLGLDASANHGTDYTVKVSDGSGTDKDGGDLTIASGNSTGSGTSSVIVSTPAAGASSATVRTAAERMRITSANVTFTALPRLPAYTVATLPSTAATGMVQGAMALVTDATAPTYLGTLTGGGAVVCPVFYNGSAWVSH